VPNISFEKDAHFATLHSHLSSWSLCVKIDTAMDVFLDVHGRQIRLSAERKYHLESEHPEMANQIDRIALTLREPDQIIRSKTDNEVELHYRFFDITPVTRKHLCVVVKAATSDLFIINHSIFY
jgi:hypothetical protein